MLERRGLLAQIGQGRGQTKERSLGVTESDLHRATDFHSSDPGSVEKRAVGAALVFEHPHIVLVDEYGVASGHSAVGDMESSVGMPPDGNDLIGSEGDGSSVVGYPYQPSVVHVARRVLGTSVL